MGIKELLALIAGFLLLHNTRSDDLTCQVTQTAEGTLCTVQQFGTSWDYYWTNSTNHSLALRVELEFKKTDQVLNYNQTSLHLKNCLELVYLKATDLQGHEYTAKCTTVCSKKQPESPAAAIRSKKQPEPAGRGRIGFYLSLGSLLVLILVLVLVIVCRITRLQSRLSSFSSKLDLDEVSTQDESSEPDPEAACG